MKPSRPFSTGSMLSNPVNTLREYYGRRAPEFEGFYHRELDPESRREVDGFAAPMNQALRDRRVLEVACGTGYWTARAARVARHVVATDASPEMLALARRKRLPADKVDFLRADAYALEGVPVAFDAALANFWLSHVPKARVGEFLRGLHAKLEPDGVVFMADGVFVGNRGGLIRYPGGEDTFQVRRLADGSVHKVLKNHYDAEHLRALFDPLAENLEMHVGARGFWWVRYEVGG